MSDLRPAAQLPIRDLKVLRVLSDPLRQRIIAHLNDTPRTIHDVADRLEVDPHRLYYHVHLLEKHGLLRVTGSRTINGIVEKHYQVTAHDFVVASELLSPTPPHPALEEILRFTLRRTEEQAREMVRRGIIDLEKKSPEPEALLSRMQFTRLNRDQASAFSRRLADLVQEFSAASCENEEDDAGYWLSATLFPCDLAPDERSPS